YPELVLSKVQDPPDPGADFPQAPIEPGIYAQLRGPHRMLIGLANDEIGYILPKRQWDEQPPYCYGRKGPQYGEGNSLGPETAPRGGAPGAGSGPGGARRSPGWAASPARPAGPPPPLAARGPGRRRPVPPRTRKRRRTRGSPQTSSTALPGSRGRSVDCSRAW